MKDLYVFSCSRCLQTDDACGWCVYSKVCSGTPASSCINGTDNYLQVRAGDVVKSLTNLILYSLSISQANIGMSQDYTHLCPQLDHPSFGENYLQPVQLNKNIELVTRNLPPEVYRNPFSINPDHLL